MAARTTIKVPHLGGTSAGYRISNNKIDSNKATVVLINSMCTTVSLYNDQFGDKSLTSEVNLLAIEPLGHGSTSCPSEHFTYWDSALMSLQVMEALGVQEAYALGTSQGGWIVTRMALLAPEKVKGLLLLGTSMDYESADSRKKGCWDPKTQLAPFYEKWSVPAPDFVVDEVWRGMVANLGFSGTLSQEMLSFWDATMKEVYSGDEGRKKLRMALLNLMERDGLLGRLRDIQVPVTWLQGPEDPVFGKTVPAEQIKMFTTSPKATLAFIEGAGHYLNATHTKETNDAILEIVKIKC